MQLSLIPKTLGKLVKQNSPLTLTVLGSAGVLITAALAIKATPKAVSILECEKRKTQQDKVPPLKVVQLVWKEYIPAISWGVVTLAAIGSAHTIHSRRSAALIGAYTITDTAFREYKDAVRTELGEKTETKIYDAVAKKTIEEHPPKETLLIGEEDTETLCYDSLTGRYFRSSIETIRAAQNDVGEAILNDTYASQNDFYDRIGLPPADIGEILGWTIDNRLRVVFSSMLTEKNKPCLVLNYQEQPRPNYYRLG